MEMETIDIVASFVHSVVYTTDTSVSDGQNPQYSKGVFSTVGFMFSGTMEVGRRPSCLAPTPLRMRIQIPQPWEFAVADFNQDGVDDIVAVYETE